MSYRLTVTRTEPNPDYAEQVKAHEERRRYGNNFGDGGYPMMEREVDCLKAAITESEWEIIKRALVQFWATEKPPVPAEAQP